MGTHPIFESDFDCLTEMEIARVKNVDELKELLERLRKILVEKFGEVDHKKWTPLYLTAGTMGLGYWYIRRTFRYWKDRGVPGPEPSILGFGNTVELFAGISDKSKGGTKWAKEYGSMYGIYSMIFTPSLVINNPMIARELSVKKFSTFTTRGRSKINTAFGKLATKFMTVLEGKPWKRQRSSITPFFSGARLNEQTPDRYERINERVFNDGHNGCWIQYRSYGESRSSEKSFVPR